ncbi:hypothetical protein AX14_011110 [Amanita brunnescens Koide BX004]|nr:hypothetical protein AX14_011110 [Amanita brunnescens Koide BX004]
MPRNSETDPTVGRLIDLDHAKVVDSWRKIEATNDNSPVVGVLKHVTPISLPSINLEVIEEFIKRFEVENSYDPLSYISDVIKTRAADFDLHKDHDIKVSDIGWHHEFNNPPDFSTHTPRQGLQTGTLPFMSAEILHKGPVFPVNDDTKNICSRRARDEYVAQGTAK